MYNVLVLKQCASELGCTRELQQYTPLYNLFFVNIDILILLYGQGGRGDERCLCKRELTPVVVRL